MPEITSQQLLELNLTDDNTKKIVEKINKTLSCEPAEVAWKKISKTILSPQLPFSFHLLVFSCCFPEWQIHPTTAPAWLPDAEQKNSTHLAQSMGETEQHTLSAFHAWTVNSPTHFWQYVLTKLHIQFAVAPTQICDLTLGPENPRWLVNAKFNIAASCFKADPQKIAIIQQKKNGPLDYFTYAELDKLSNRIANSLQKMGFISGDAIAINLPMNFHAVAIYFGIIKMGGVVVSIADSFSKDEIASRLRIAQAKGIFTQDVLLRDEKTLPLYEKVAASDAPVAIVLPVQTNLTVTLRSHDIAWQDFLLAEEHFDLYLANAETPCNILFSSGTTGDPKAIPWTHATPIKAASDAYFHQDIHAEDILAWPTNLGWMMGPWLIFAGLINNATIALYDDAPRDRHFGEFIEKAQVTVLGVVPTLVAHWRQTACMQGLDWQHIKCFSSTGECSNPEDMLYLMSLAGYKPIIEYCGGTEIGGGYLSSTLIENNYPSIFTTPAMGLDFVLLDEDGKLTDNGEVAIVPPSIGLSLTLLNVDHHQTYFANMPTLPDGKLLRRHGDQIQRLALNRYCVLGRVDDTMNLGAIKVSSAEIERVLVGTEHITETAAIAINPHSPGPSCLVIFAATSKNLDKNDVKKKFQSKINQHLNPLFKIHDVVLVGKLPKTASNKIMRRVLRKQYPEV